MSGRKAKEKRATAEAERPFSNGLVFVHGIGAQRAGRTLKEFEVPLRSMIGLVFPDISISSESFDETDKLPAYTSWWLDSPMGSSRWLLVEARWADAFSPPDARPFRQWMAKVKFWFIVFHFCAAMILRLQDLGRETDVAFKKRNYWLFAIKVAALLGMPLVMAWGFLWRLFFIPIILVACRLLLRFRRIAGLKQLAGIISAFLGDSFALIADPAAEEKMLERISRDYKWCRTQSTWTTIVAHSQGAYLSRKVVEQVGSPKTQLVTLGAGVATLHALSQVGMPRSYRDAAWFVAILSALVCLGIAEFVLIVPWRNETDPAGVALDAFLKCFMGRGGTSQAYMECADTYLPNDLPGTIAVAGISLGQGILVLLLIAVLPYQLQRAARSVMGKMGLLAAWKNRGKELSLPSNRKAIWLDYSSPRDPVSLGGLLTECADEVTLISNKKLISILEHVAYSQNPAVLSRILWIVFSHDSVHSADMDVLAQAFDTNVERQRRFEARLQAGVGLLSLAIMISLIALNVHV